MNIKKLFGKRLQEIRKSKKITQEALAELMGIETASLSNIERGKYFPSVENLEKILSILKIDLTELCSYEHLRNRDELRVEINEILDKNPDKIGDFYKIIKALAK